MSTWEIPFNKPYMTGKELYYIAEAKFGNILAGDGPFTKSCHGWLEQKDRLCQGVADPFLHCGAGDGGPIAGYPAGRRNHHAVLHLCFDSQCVRLARWRPVFVDIREDTLNLDERLIEAAITPRTKAIVPVHYAGVACEMDTIMAIARRHGLSVVEDAAQGVMSSYKGRALGSIGDLGAYSFHETKNVISGEGGALLVNDPELALRAEIIREKGTDRSRFFRGEVDKYTWQEVGSSFLPGELIAAFLWAQLEEAERITSERLASWARYHELLEPLEAKGILRRPVVPEGCQHNAHMYYVLLAPGIDRQARLERIEAQRDSLGIPLCAAAFFARRAAIWAGAWGVGCDQSAVGKVGTIAVMGRFGFRATKLHS